MTENPSNVERALKTLDEMQRAAVIAKADSAHYISPHWLASACDIFRTTLTPVAQAPTQPDNVLREAVESFSQSLEYLVQAAGASPFNPQDRRAAAAVVRLEAVRLFREYIALNAPQPAAPEAALSGEGGDAERVIRLGVGEISTNWGQYGNEFAVFLEPVSKAGPIGEKIPETEVAAKKDRLAKGAVVLIIAGAPLTFEEDLATAKERAGFATPKPDAEMRRALETMSPTDQTRLMVMFAKAADFTTDRDRRIYDALSQARQSAERNATALTKASEPLAQEAQTDGGGA